ncbi:iron-sulfur cluster assembly scaffold protein [Candidatus Hydrogenosomobacter endosymbioticus]|nr:iron-sulfur cluster assembly scaffold protein [Candidatus Hydrogenosomobacter endosymbioticus]
MKYSEKIVEHCMNPRNVGEFDEDDVSVGTGIVGSPACGDVVKIQIKVDESGVIEDVRFKVFGCSSAIAAGSFAAEWLCKKTIDEALKIQNSEVARELELAPVKFHCSVLIEQAIREAVSNYFAKKSSVNEVA